MAAHSKKLILFYNTNCSSVMHHNVRFKLFETIHKFIATLFYNYFTFSLLVARKTTIGLKLEVSFIGGFEG